MKEKLEEKEPENIGAISEYNPAIKEMIKATKDLIDKKKEGKN